MTFPLSPLCIGPADGLQFEPWSGGYRITDSQLQELRDAMSPPKPEGPSANEGTSSATEVPAPDVAAAEESTEAPAVDSEENSS